MAQYEIRKSCGHVETEQIYGSDQRGGRRYQAKQLAQIPCRSCRDAAHDQVNGRAADVAAAAGLPALTGGTDKQVAWAQTVRLDSLAALVDAAYERAGRARRPDWTDEQTDAAAEALLDAWRAAALRHTDAAWWLDNRTTITSAAMASLTAEDRAGYKQRIDAIGGTR
jgi:hypothetical protein